MIGFLKSTWDLLVKGGMMAVGFLRGLKGEGSTSLVLLVCLMAADYLSGLAAAMLHKSDKTPSGGISSEAGGKGLLKKAMILLVVLVAMLLDRTSAQPTHMFQSAVTWFYISNEAISLLENLSKAGVPIPRRFRTLLEQTTQEQPPVAEQAPAQPAPPPEAVPTPESEEIEAVAVFHPSSRRQNLTPTRGGRGEP